MTGPPTSRTLGIITQGKCDGEYQRLHSTANPCGKANTNEANQDPNQQAFLSVLPTSVFLSVLPTQPPAD